MTKDYPLKQVGQYLQLELNGVLYSTDPESPNGIIMPPDEDEREARKILDEIKDFYHPICKSDYIDGFLAGRKSTKKKFTEEDIIGFGIWLDTIPQSMIPETGITGLLEMYLLSLTPAPETATLEMEETYTTFGIQPKTIPNNRGGVDCVVTKLNYK